MSDLKASAHAEWLAQQLIVRDAARQMRLALSAQTEPIQVGQRFSYLGYTLEVTGINGHEVTATVVPKKTMIELTISHDDCKAKIP